MSLWSKLFSKSENNIIKISTGEQIVGSLKGPYVRHLFHHSGISQDSFDGLYIKTLTKFSEMVQSLPASEVHHHSHHQGLLIHSLEVAIFALKIRQSYILPKGKPIEQADKEKDVWNFAIFTAALLHDIGKPIIDQEVYLYKKNKPLGRWNPWLSFMSDTQATHYQSRYHPQRDYELHKRLGLSVMNRVIPPDGVNWIAQNKLLFKHWLAALTNDIGPAEEIGEIVQKADQQSGGLGTFPRNFPPPHQKH